MEGEGNTMLQQTLIQRPMVPVSYLTPLSTYSMCERNEKIGAVPVCISMESPSMSIEDLIRDIDFSPKRKRKSASI